MIKKIVVTSLLTEKSHKLHTKWEYMDDPTYSRSINSHVCMTCSRFDYLSQANVGSILCCNWHQKLICHGQHLTHSCKQYQKNFDIRKKYNQTIQAA